LSRTTSHKKINNGNKNIIPIEKDYKLAETSIKDKILLDSRKDLAVDAFKQKATALAQSKGINTKEKRFIIQVDGSSTFFFSLKFHIIDLF
jgi:hypothetical protein